MDRKYQKGVQFRGHILSVLPFWMAGKTFPKGEYVL